MKYKTIDICAGIGGIRRGFELAGGFENVLSAEIDEAACKTYEKLFGENPLNDITDSSFKKMVQNTDYDVLLAGFPCQSFSSVGLQQGFEDKIKGTIFFDITKIIKMSNPKVIFLENVQNLLVHDNKETFKTIVETLDKDLNYHIVGLQYDEKGNMINTKKEFIRNSKDFGIPQNRPRVYIIGFSRLYYGAHLDSITNELPYNRSKPPIYASLDDVLDKTVDAKYFLSKGYLETLERHIVREKEKGNGFGYRIINAPSIEKPIANTLLATGGSGRERNLIYDPINGKEHANKKLRTKKTVINNKNIRAMTPEEWGRLQGFIGYAFINEEKEDMFAFPDGFPDTYKYKQLGNSVTIPVVEELAIFIKRQLEQMEKQFDIAEHALYQLYGNEYLISRAFWEKNRIGLRWATLEKFFLIIKTFSKCNSFRVKDVAKLLGVTQARASQMIDVLRRSECVFKKLDGSYGFYDYRFLI